MIRQTGNGHSAWEMDCVWSLADPGAGMTPGCKAGTMR